MGEPNSSGRGYISVIHPLFAMMLTFFNNTEFDEATKRISTFLHLPLERVKQQMQLLVENPQIVTNGTSGFPKRTIVEYDSKKMTLHNYKPEQFIYKDVDVRISRLQVPNDIVCNVTMKCMTSCFYCYADRKGKTGISLPIELLEKVIEEAKHLGVLRFQLIGGEVLLYKDWERALKKLSICGFSPWISTKLPLTETNVKKLKEMNFNSPIQISLDTLIKGHLYKILRISDPYYEQMLHGIELLEKYGIEYYIHTVLNKWNSSIEDITSLEHYLKNKKYLRKWILDAAKCSMYLNIPYSFYQAPDDKIKEIENYILTLNKKNIFDFKISEPSVAKDINTYTIKDKERIFKKRTMCSANLSSLYILPDGQVTICEELYWHPRFLLGDLHTQTLEEIWNSQKAKDLFYIKQSDFQKSSPCRTCQDFAECHEYKHVCWRNVIWAYGKDNWDYPDIFCPKAPHVENTVYV